MTETAEAGGSGAEASKAMAQAPAAGGATAREAGGGGSGSLTASMLGFHREMLEGALEEDSLVVSARGLGHHVLITKLVQLYCQKVDHARASGKSRVPLVYIVNASEKAAALQRAVVERGGAEARCTPPVVVTNSLTSAARRALYLEGGCFIVTSRILVVDLLSAVIDLDRVTGVVVDGAHRVSDTSNSGFILNILRTSSQFSGFVKAFCDAPEALAAKFGFLAQVMGTLGVGKLHLWPRFHLSVRATLDKARPVVTEYGQPLTALMAGIQRELVTLLEMCLTELRKTQNIDVSGLTVENGLFRSFEVTLRRQLDPLWHKVGRKTKQLVHDVGVLRRLLPDLLRLDAVTFLRVLDGIRDEVTGHQAPSLWLLTDSADRMFRYARTRVFRTPKLKTKRSADSLAVMDPTTLPSTIVLDGTGQQQCKLKIDVEENPKFGLLRRVIREVRTLLRHRPSSSLQRAAGGAEAIVFCHDELTARDIRSRLKENALAAVNRRRLETYLGLRFRRWCGANGLAHLAGGSAARGSLRLTSEDTRGLHDLLRALYLGPRPTRGDNAFSGVDRRYRSAVEAAAKAPVESRLFLAEHVRRLLALVKKTNVQELSVGEEAVHEVVDLDQDQDHEAPSGWPRAEVVVFPVEGGDGASELLSILEEMRPRFVIMFEPDVEAVRTVEVYEAARAAAQNAQLAPEPIQMFFLQYQDSVEEQRYLSDLKREQDTFRKLIDEKAGLVLASASQGWMGESKNATALQDDLTAKSRNIVGYNLSTGEPIFESAMSRPRHAKAAVVPRIVVDMREFRSALPSLLHKNGVHVEPATLEVGDYILAPEICVERKSIPDLHGSFNSGRLFTQAEAMCKYYQRPNLLIEFDEGKPFSLQAVTDISSDISHSSILSKMVLLTMHFPALRLLWSPSPHATVDLFKLMKTNYDNPEAALAAAIGMPDNLDNALPPAAPASVLDAFTTSSSNSSFGSLPRTATSTVNDPARDALKAQGQQQQQQQEGNVAAQEVLRRLPGITVHNVGAILSNVRNLRELSLMSQEDLMPLIGRAGAVKLYKFFNQDPDEDPDAAAATRPGGAAGAGAGAGRERYMTNVAVAED
ncbi:DNA repair endonuclease XPF [Hondaea fermentalgiana]|uniref:DNA repair endonuclease XPF n=1 Tax=Hondaea fermentalgiana TaxID=2315210 RepID=A0A2R5GUH4_9STRA|nr:DNA repair endonuclease XPF [Hondaea fermentalgiana]|eukprot:GBG34527.1 DNA repair endonuclease XPF [Hondaea fermentalgiana]